MRYFIEVSYKGNDFAGFQIQPNAVTVQSELERALRIFFRSQIDLTGSSRTDTGVHALQNYFHFDSDIVIREGVEYSLNAIVHNDIAVRRIVAVKDSAHCRFDAVARHYSYKVYDRKNPFLSDRAYFFPYRVDEMKMMEAAGLVMDHSDFTSFAKKNAQNKTFICRILGSEWVRREEYLEYRVSANRFLRGMVRGLVGTMLQVGRGKMSVEEFGKVIEGRNSAAADFAVPGHGLCLEKVVFEEGYF